LSLTNEPEKLVNMALDTLSQTLNIECCWIQTIDDRKNHQLSLAAERGFSDEMRSEIISINLNHGFSGQIIGMGHKIIIQNLNNDGLYGLSSFRAAGYKWLVAVPLMTYRVYGILGAASHNRRLLQKETADLIMVIAGLIAGSLSKAHLSRSFPPRNESVILTARESQKETPLPDINTEISSDMPSSGLPSQKNLPKHTDMGFHSHTHKMESFRKSHR
jgi:signal transduction protein with GAF and PtsI domain